MGINMAICETECVNALCRERKGKVLKVLVKDPVAYGSAAEYEMFLPVEDALRHFNDKEDFRKRNRIREDTKVLYLDRLKCDEDRCTLEKVTVRTYTGWVDVSETCDETRCELISASLPEERQTEWEMTSFEETEEMCSRCTLSWDKGRGCIGSFGPDNGLLPEIARKADCNVTASVPEGARSKRIYTKEDAEVLLREIPVLRDALEKDGKLAVRRYSGPVDRLEAVASISVKENCGFFFF